MSIAPEIAEFLADFDIAIEVEQAEWDYQLPEQFQEDAGVQDFTPLPDAGWDYTLPEQYQY